MDGRFTDIHLARSDDPPQPAVIDSSFSGVQAVPEPGSLALAGVGILVLLGYRYVGVSGEDSGPSRRNADRTHHAAASSATPTTCRPNPSSLPRG